MTSASLALIIATAVGLTSAAEACAAPPSPAKTPDSKQVASKAATTTDSKLPKNGQSCLELTGKSALFGPFSMKIGEGFNIRAKFGFTIWGKDKPDEVYVLNAENHVYIRESQEEWLTWNRRGLPTINITEVEVVDKPTISGHPCVHYYGYQKVRNERVRTAEFFCLQKAPCDSKAVEFWCKHYLLPAKYGFPIIVKQRVGHNLAIVLDTRTIGAVPAATVSFKVPRDYKETKDKAVLYFSESGGLNKSDLEEFFQQPLK